MKTLRSLMIVASLAVAGAAYSQTTPVPAQPVPNVPQADPVPTTPETDKKSEFNAPQTPNRQPQIPSEDTLIKSRTNPSAVIKDTLMPSKTEKKDRRKNRKGTVESDDSTSSNGQPGTIKKP